MSYHRFAVAIVVDNQLHYLTQWENYGKPVFELFNWTNEESPTMPILFKTFEEADAAVSYAEDGSIVALSSNALRNMLGRSRSDRYVIAKGKGKRTRYYEGSTSSGSHWSSDAKYAWLYTDEEAASESLVALANKYPNARVELLTSWSYNPLA